MISDLDDVEQVQLNQQQQEVILLVIESIFGPTSFIEAQQLIRRSLIDVQSVQGQKVLCATDKATDIMS